MLFSRQQADVEKTDVADNNDDSFADESDDQVNVWV